MSKHLIVILLLISLAFNLAVLGMFLYTAKYHKAPFNPHRIFGPIDRSGPGWERFHHRRDTLETRLDNNDEIRKLRDDYRQMRINFLQVMMKDKFLEQEAAAAMQASLKAQENLEKKLGESLIELRKKLSPEEAKALFKERMDRIERRHNIYRKRLEHFIEDNKPQGDTK